MSDDWADLGLDDLLAAEREGPGAPPAARSRVLGRVMATLAVPPPPTDGGLTGASGAASSSAGTGAAVSGGAATGSSILGATKIWLLTGALSVGAGVVALQPKAVPESPPKAHSARLKSPKKLLKPVKEPVIAKNAVAEMLSNPEPAELPHLSEPLPPKFEATPKAVPEPPKPRRPRPRGVSKTPKTSSLAAEQALLETARRHLAAGQSAAALTTLGRHARRYPRGRLGEERDFLRVRTLHRTGKLRAAKKAAQRFKKRYPKSLLRGAMERILKD